MFDPERYESNKSVASAEVEAFVPQLIRAMSWSQIGQTILDYGCGAGSIGYHYIFLPLAQFTDSKLYSVDISPKMVEYARKQYGDERIVYAIGNILGEFPFSGIKFDKIFSIHVFHFISDIRKVLDGLHRILKPSGQLGFTSVTINSFVVIRLVGDSCGTGNVAQGYEKFLPLWSNYEGTEDGKQYFQDLLEDAGFVVRELTLQSRHYKYDNIEVFLDFAMSLNPRLEVIPKVLHPILREEFRSIMTGLAGIPADSTSIVYTHEYLYVVAEKNDDVNEE